jgi:hypothetical protein
LPGTNALAYYGNLKITAVISFMIRAPGERRHLGPET